MHACPRTTIMLPSRCHSRRSDDGGDDSVVTVASRLDPNALQTIGVGQVLHELVAALDSALVQRKLVVAIGWG